MTLPVETVELGVRFATGTAIVAALIFFARGALRMLMTGELRLLLRSASAMRGELAESDECCDGAVVDRSAKVVYCRSDGRAELAATCPLPRN